MDLSAIRLLNRAVTLTIITVWFAVIFRYLPDARISWKAIWIGAALTSVLFQVGKLVLGELLVGGDLDTIYGAAGSIILLLLFIFYSSFLFSTTVQRLPEPTPVMRGWRARSNLMLPNTRSGR